eukprot:SAG31_NODE_2212_length_6174_cov_11.856790_1_plen_89_part_00
MSIPRMIFGVSDVCHGWHNICQRWGSETADDFISMVTIAQEHILAFTGHDFVALTPRWCRDMASGLASGLTSTREGPFYGRRSPSSIG